MIMSIPIHINYEIWFELGQNSLEILVHCYLDAYFVSPCILQKTIKEISIITKSSSRLSRIVISKEATAIAIEKQMLLQAELRIIYLAKVKLITGKFRNNSAQYTVLVKGWMNDLLLPADFFVCALWCHLTEFWYNQLS